MSLFPATTLRWRFEPALLSLPRLPGPLLAIGITTFSCVVSSIGNGGGGDEGGGGGGSRATITGAASRSNTSLWYFCKYKKYLNTVKYVTEYYIKGRKGYIFITLYSFYFLF
jgi:hypothetical protein